MTTSRPTRVQASLTELGAVVPLAAIALLLTNDHVLKSTFHNAVTGKLSDVAICFLLPLLVSATLGMIVPWTAARRLWLGAAVTAVVFSALEMSDVAGAGFRRVMAALLGAPIVLTRDPTDLLALAVVPLALAYGRWRGRRPQPPPRRWGTAAGALSLMGGALALMADGPPARCASWSAPVAFQVQGDCGENGLIVVEADAHFAELKITNGPALLRPPQFTNPSVNGRYAGTSCPYTLEKGEWEVTVGSCVNGGNLAPVVDAGALAEDASAAGGADAGGNADADASAPAVDAGAPEGPSCSATSRKCRAALEGGALWFTCIGEDTGLPLCRSRLTVFP